MSITIKTPQEIEKMRVAGRLTAEVLDYITPHVKAGVTTGELDQLCHDYIVKVQGCIPASQLRSARLQALSEIDLRLGKPPGLSWSSR